MSKWQISAVVSVSVDADTADLAEVQGTSILVERFGVEVINQGVIHVKNMDMPEIGIDYDEYIKMLEAHDE